MPGAGHVGSSMQTVNTPLQTCPVCEEPDAVVERADAFGHYLVCVVCGAMGDDDVPGALNS
jgi:translation initiation factor 2 beta subunit (eIF-2beta)/eIF-5